MTVALKRHISVTLSQQYREIYFSCHPALCPWVFPFHPSACLWFLLMCSCQGRDVCSVSTARENTQVICRILSDSPQKACPSQSPAKQPPLTLPTQRCRIMWEDKTVMSREGRIETCRLLQQATDKRDQNTHWVLSVLVAQGFVRRLSVMWVLCVTERVSVKPKNIKSWV